jgi:hypothetical protein
VHCKSKDAKGVAEASSFCIEKWMEPIFTTSPAKVVVLLGSKVRDYYAKPVLGAGNEFGSSQGYGELTQKERAVRDIFVETVGGVNRVFVFNWHPVHAGMRVFRKVYGDQLVDWLAAILEGKESVPEKNELHSKLMSFFA